MSLWHGGGMVIFVQEFFLYFDMSLKYVWSALDVGLGSLMCRAYPVSMMMAHYRDQCQ